MKKFELIAIAIGAIAVIFFLTKILQKLGIVKSKRKREQDENIEEFREADYFSPTFYKTVGAYNPITETEADIFAKAIRKSLRGFGTNEEELYSVFKQMKNKTNISQVAEMFGKKYRGKDMKSEIMNELNKKEISVLMGIINQLPLKN